VRYWFEVVVKFINERDAGRDIEIGDFIVRDVVEVFYESPQAVSVSGDEDFLFLF